MKNNKKVKSLVLIITLICTIVSFISIYKIAMWYQDINQNNSIKIETNRYVIKKQKEYEIDFNKLKEQNKDIIGYLKVKNTNIDYVVVKGTDNSYYLSHDFKKNHSIAGWIFASYQNKIDGSDKNIVIFGHNMRDNSMFGTLKNVLTKKWYSNKDNLTIEFATEKETSSYQVFSVYQIPAEDYYINTEFDNDEDYLDFINTITKRSINDFDVQISKEDKILTLSTCSQTGKERVVLHAKKI